MQKYLDFFAHVAEKPVTVGTRIATSKSECLQQTAGRPMTCSRIGFALSTARLQAI